MYKALSSGGRSGSSGLVKYTTEETVASGLWNVTHYPNRNQLAGFALGLGASCLYIYRCIYIYINHTMEQWQLRGYPPAVV